MATAETIYHALHGRILDVEPDAPRNPIFDKGTIFSVEGKIVGPHKKSSFLNPLISEYWLETEFAFTQRLSPFKMQSLGQEILTLRQQRERLRLTSPIISLDDESIAIHKVAYLGLYDAQAIPRQWFKKYDFRRPYVVEIMQTPQDEELIAIQNEGDQPYSDFMEIMYELISDRNNQIHLISPEKH